ncbi:MAG: alpha/beta fold hydrolase [Candidatus Helarchaeota archaeon]
MSKFEQQKYDDTWFNYCIDADPTTIKNAISEIYITGNNKKIHLDIFGKNDESLKTNIIFIHGTAVYSRFYAEFLYNLYKNGFRIIAPDMPGHGLSEGKRGHFNMKELISTIYDITTYVIENYGENVAIMGSSLGGITALYATANDERIKAAICHNAAIFNEGAHKKIVKVKGFIKYLKPLLPFFSKLFPTLRLSVWIYLDPKSLIKSDEWDEKVEILLRDKFLSDKYTLKALATQMRAPLAKPIENIKTPIMIINGSNDVLFSIEYMKEIFDRLVNSQNKKLVIIPDSAHLILHENRNESLHKIVNWLNSIF